jgi:hypothetical protein
MRLKKNKTAQATRKEFPDPEHTRKMILTRVLLVPFLAVLALFGTLLYLFAQNLQEGVKTNLVYITEQHRNIIDDFLQERSVELRLVAHAQT